MNIISPVKCMAMLFMYLLMPGKIALEELLNKHAIHSSPLHDPGWLTCNTPVQEALHPPLPLTTLKCTHLESASEEGFL